MASATIIIPCYNEETRFSIDAFRTFSAPSHAISFLFVDDGSVDNTSLLLQTLKSSNTAMFGVIRFEENLGKAEAVRQGILAARNSRPDYVGFWDADLATPLNQISEFIDLAENRLDLEMIIGSRVKLLGRKIERRPSRHYLGRVFATAVSILLDLEIYDTQCGSKIFRTSPALYALFEQPFHSRWIFDVEIFARLIQARCGMDFPGAGDIIYEFPLKEWRDIPGSKVRLSDFVRAAWELFYIHSHYMRTCHGRRTSLPGSRCYFGERSQLP